MTEDEWDDKLDDLRDKIYDWWENISLIVIFVSLIFFIVFAIKGNDDKQIISGLVLIISYCLHVCNPFGRGGGSPFGWF